MRTMSLKFSSFYCTETGVRSRNEDAVGMILPTEPALSNKGMIAAIADGVSGGINGHQAADYAVEALLRDYYAVPEELPVAQALDKTIKTINLRINQLGSLHGGESLMATTLTALVIRQNYYYVSHVGDSRLYRLRGDKLEQLTTDHVLDQAAKKNVLTRAMGLNPSIVVDHGMGEIDNGDIFLLATDGVWSVLPEHELSWHLSELIDDKRSAENTARLLIDAAVAAGSTDNMSVLLVRAHQIPEAG